MHAFLNQPGQAPGRGGYKPQASELTPIDESLLVVGAAILLALLAVYAIGIYVWWRRKSQFARVQRTEAIGSSARAKGCAPGERAYAHPEQDSASIRKQQHDSSDASRHDDSVSLVGLSAPFSTQRQIEHPGSDACLEEFEDFQVAKLNMIQRLIPNRASSQRVPISQSLDNLD